MHINPVRSHLMVLEFYLKSSQRTVSAYFRVWNKPASMLTIFQTFFQGAWTLFQTKGLNYFEKKCVFWMKYEPYIAEIAVFQH